MYSGTYAFIYDDVLNDRRYERAIAEVDVRLTSLDLQGRVVRLSLFRSAKELVEQMVREGVTTIVIIGNDQSLDKMLWFLPDLDITVGYIPVVEPWGVATLLGIPNGPAACDVVAARFVEVLDVGKIDNRYFLTSVRMPRTMAAVDIEGHYRLSAVHGGSITIQNIGQAVQDRASFDEAKDGFLEVVIEPSESPNASRWGRRKRERQMKKTRAFIRYGKIISSEPVDVQVDSHVVNGFQFSLEIVPKKFRLITSRAVRSDVDPEGGLPKTATSSTLRAAGDRLQTRRKTP